MNETARRWLVIAIVIAVAAAAYFYFSRRLEPAEPVSGSVPPPVSTPAGPRHPIDAVERPAAEPDDDAAAPKVPFAVAACVGFALAGAEHMLWFWPWNPLLG